MRAIRQRRVGSPAPGAARLDRHQHRRWRAVYGNDNGGTGFTGPGKGWRAVLRVEHIIRQLAVSYGANDGDLRRNGIEGNGKDRTRRADVTRCVHARHGNVERTVRLRWKRQVPFPVSHHDTAHFDAVVVDDHRLTVDAGSAHCRCGIRDVATVRLTAHCTNHRRIRRQGIHDDGNRWRRVRDVARFIGGGGGIGVAALGNVAARAPAPVAAAVYRDGAHDGRYAVDGVSDVDDVVRRAGAAQDRARIVGGSAIGYGAGDLGDAVGDGRCRRRSRRFGINGDGYRLRRGAFVARAVHVGDGQGDVIGTAGQWG